jgi:hypothetical protein
MSPGRPQHGPAAMLPAVQVRVTPIQRTYLLLLAERQHCSISEAIRRLIDAQLDAEPVAELAGGSGLGLRRLLEMADHDNVEPDPAWLQAYGEGE